MSSNPEDTHTFVPRNLHWCPAFVRMALLNEVLVLVAAVSMHALGVLSGRADPAPGLIYHLVWMQGIGMSGLLVIGTVNLWVVRRAWQAMPDAARQYDRHSAYLGLPRRDQCVLALTTLGSVLASAWLARMVMAACLPWLAQQGMAPLPPPGLALFNMAYGALVIYAFEFLHDRATWNRHRARRAHRLGTRAQLDLLRSQVDPHMLFNTLANVSDLIDEDPAQAKAMLRKLNGFLRTSLQGSRATQHALRDEFKLIGDYLGLMQIRMGDRLSPELLLPDDLALQPVPPMLLQPLVENAIQHGLAPRRAGGQLTVRASREGEQIRVSVVNTGDPPQAVRAGQGVGLKLVAERLHAWHGSRASLQLQHEPTANLTVATLLWPRQAPLT